MLLSNQAMNIPKDVDVTEEIVKLIGIDAYPPFLQQSITQTFQVAPTSFTACVCVCAFMYVYMHAYIHIHIHMHTYTCIHTYIYMRTHTCICIHIHTYVYIHIHMQIKIIMHSSRRKPKRRDCKLEPRKKQKRKGE